MRRGVLTLSTFQAPLCKWTIENKSYLSRIFGGQLPALTLSLFRCALVTLLFCVTIKVNTACSYSFYCLKMASKRQRHEIKQKEIFQFQRFNHNNRNHITVMNWEIVSFFLIDKQTKKMAYVFRYTRERQTWWYWNQNMERIESWI